MGEVIEGTGLWSLLPKRRDDAHKGTYGRVLLMAGSRGMAGAALLAGEAAYRAGCGLAAVAGTEDNRVILQIGLPEALWRDREQIPELLSWADAVAAGPGIGTDQSAWEGLKAILEGRRGPLVLDADALNLLSLHPEGWQWIRENPRVVITPHPKEMNRISGVSMADIAADPAGCAQRFAREHHVICVLKGHRSVVTDGERICINRSGCEGMAVGGSGDVLTGILASLAAQSAAARSGGETEDLFSLICLGVYVHGLAGEAAASVLGSRSMLARDITAHLPDVLKGR